MERGVYRLTGVREAVLVRAAPDALPMNAIQAIGTHNSYKMAIAPNELAMIRAVNPNVELEIWGNGDIAPYREALADAEGVRLEHRWLEESEIAGVFDRTDICVLPYREASQSAVVASALSVGMPVVTTPLPSLIEQIGGTRTGRISSDFSPQSFARAILDLVASPADYHSLSQGALAFSQEALSWDSIGDKIEDAMRQLRSMPPRHAA